MEIEIFSITFCTFLWLISAWGALSQLSGGMARRYESVDKEIAKKLENCVEEKEEYDIIFTLLAFFMIAIMAANGFVIASEHCPGWTTTEKIFAASGGVFILAILAEIVARLFLFRLDIFLLRFTIPVVRILRYSIFFPPVFLLRGIQSKIEKIRQNDERFEDKTTAEDEILSLVEKDDEEPSLEEDEKRMIKSIFDLDDTFVREIMTPRVDVKGLPLTASIEEAKREFIESGHSRIPIFSENIDEIKGIIYAKDFLDEASLKGKKLMDLAHVPSFIPETKGVGDLLDELRKKQSHFVVIIDEYGGTSGILTLEDIIEEIVGEIRDEYDLEEDKELEPEILPDGSVVIEARTLISDVNDLLDVDIPEDEDVDTIGGYACSEFGKIPEVGEEITIEKNIRVTILKADERKIITLKLKILEDAND